MPDVNDERQGRLLTALRAAAESLNKLGDDERASAADGVELLESTIAYVQVIVEQTDGRLITDSAMSGIESHANAIAGNPTGTAVSARQYADPMLNAVAVLPIARDRAVEQAVREVAANFQRSATHRLNALGGDVAARRAEIDEELTNLRTAVEETTAETKEGIASQASAFEAKLTEFETTLAAQRDTIAAAQERQSEAFSEAQEERSNAFQEEIAKARDEVASMIEAAREEVDSHVAEIERMERESAGLVGAIGLAGTAERYGEEAKDQKRVADFLRNLTVVLALAAVGMAIFAALHQSDEPTAIAAKLAVSVIFGALAAYTAKQSGRHRVREERARNLQLELTAFTPFIEPLEEDQQELERVIMTRKTFGQIRALPEAEDTHTFGPLGPVEGLLKRRRAEDEAT